MTEKGTDGAALPPSATASPSAPSIPNDVQPDISHARRNNFLLLWLVFFFIGLYFVYLFLASHSTLAIEAGVAGSAVLSGPVGYAYSSRQNSRWRKWTPRRVRILSDRVAGEFDPVPGVRTLSARQVLKFQAGLRFFDSGGLWAVPRVVCFPPPLGWEMEPHPGSTGDMPGVAIVFVLTSANVRAVREAWRAWKKGSEPAPDTLYVPSRPAAYPPALGVPESSAVTWVENRLPDESGSRRLRWMSIGLAIFLEAMILILVVLLFSPFFGPLGAVEYGAVYFWYFFLIAPGFVLVDWLRAYLTQVPRVGVGLGGVYFKKNGRKDRFVPWGRIYGPSHQMYRGNWVVYVGKKDGSFYLWDFYQVGLEVAKRVAENPGCPRRRMTRGDAEALGLALGPSDAPQSPDMQRPLLNEDPSARRVADCLWGTDKWDSQAKWAGVYLRAVRLAIPPGRIEEIARQAGPAGPCSGTADQPHLSRLVRKDERQNTVARAVYLLYLHGDSPSERLEKRLATVSQMGRNTKGSHYGQIAWSVGIMALGAFIALIGWRSSAMLGIGFALFAIGSLLLCWDLREYRAWQALRVNPDSSNAVMSAVTHQILHGTKPTDIIREDGTIRMENLRTEGLSHGVRARVEEAKASASYQGIAK